jgi:hypothetical protein
MQNEQTRLSDTQAGEKATWGRGDLVRRRLGDEQAQRDAGLGEAAGEAPCAETDGSEINVNLSQSMHS